jgi:hypothetical protein
MRKAEIAALLRAHRNRARPVAFFHILRQTTLETDDHAFLIEHIDELGAVDLLRWRARCEKGFTAPVIRKLAELAICEPSQFRHEVLDAPRLDFEEAEWIELADLLRGKVDDETWRRVIACGSGGAAPAKVPDTGLLFQAPAGPEASFALDGASLLDGSSRQGESSFFDGLVDSEVDLGFALGAKGPGGPPEELSEPPPEEEDWSPSIPRFRVSFREAVLEKARKTPRGDERAVLLAWLEERRVAKKTLIKIAADSLLTGEISASMLAWLSKQLSNRTGWDREGVVVLVAMIERRAFPEMSELFTFSWHEASVSEGNDVPRGFLTSVQAAFALALLHVTRQALLARRSSPAMAALSALACLDPPSRVSRTIHDLRRIPGIGEEVRHLIEVNERLVKHSDARDASLEGIVAGVHALADALT